MPRGPQTCRNRIEHSRSRHLLCVLLGVYTHSVASTQDSIPSCLLLRRHPLRLSFQSRESLDEYPSASRFSSRGQSQSLRCRVRSQFLPQASPVVGFTPQLSLNLWSSKSVWLKDSQPSLRKKEARSSSSPQTLGFLWIRQLE